MLVIRCPIESDYAAMASIFHDAVRQIAKREYTETQLRAWSPEEFPPDHWRKRTSELEVRVAVMGEATAGFIGFSRSGHIDLLFTRPEMVRRGVARALLAIAENLLGQWGTRTAWTEASLSARDFFEAMDYRVVRDQTVSCRGIELRNFRMEKSLNPQVRPG